MKTAQPDTFADGADGDRAASARLDRLTDLERKLSGQTSGAHTLVRDGFGRVFLVPMALPTGTPEIEEWDAITPQQRIASAAGGNLEQRSAAILRRIDALFDGIDDVPMLVGGLNVYTPADRRRMVIAKAIFVGFDLQPFQISPISKSRWLVKGGVVRWRSFSESALWPSYPDQQPEASFKEIVVPDSIISITEGWIAVRLRIQPHTLYSKSGTGTTGGSFDVMSADIVASALQHRPAIQSISRTWKTLEGGTIVDDESTSTHTPLTLDSPLGYVVGTGETPHIIGPAPRNIAVNGSTTQLGGVGRYPFITRYD